MLEQKKEYFKFGQYNFCSLRKLEASDLELLVHGIEHPENRPASELCGRLGISIVQSNTQGPLVIKHYGRGGVLNRFIKNYYLAWGSTRAEQEMDFLLKVRSLGVNAPEPLAVAWQGKLFYRTWLVTREIQEQTSLAELCKNNEERVRLIMPELARQILLLSKNGIMHIDLHPGNVLIDRANSVYMIDFDKACSLRLSEKNMRERYLCRWRRAVLKHNLPEILLEALSMELKQFA